MSGSGFEGQIIGFYGAKHPSLFEIERRCMDRDGLVIQYLDRELPEGFVLDVGAGNGFAAIRLCSSSRTVVALEPDQGMVDEAASETAGQRSSTRWLSTAPRFGSADPELKTSQGREARRRRRLLLRSYRGLTRRIVVHVMQTPG